MKYPCAGLLAATAFELDRVEAAMAALGPAPLAASAPTRAGSVRRDRGGDVAVVPLGGFMTQRPSIFSLLGFGTSTEAFAEGVVQAMADPSVKAVVLDVDSGGGEVFGVTEAAARIRGARGAKPLIAVANPVMGSAAFQVASQADMIVATPSAIVGSIGVFSLHVDESGALAQQGLRVTAIAYGRRKLERSSLGPLSEEARAALQEQIDAFGQAFVLDVARGRRVPVATVLRDYGEGAVFTAERALKAGLVDRIGTLDQVVGQLVAGLPVQQLLRPDPARLRAQAALAGITLPVDEPEVEWPRPFDPAALQARAILAGVSLAPEFDPVQLKAHYIAAGLDVPVSLRGTKAVARR